MANRFPLIVDSSGTAAIKELASGDNLDLTGNGIVGAGTVALTNLTVGGSQGSDGQVLTSTGSGIAWEDASGGSSTFGVSTMTGDGSDTTLTLSANPGSENNTQVYIDGVYQPKSTYSVSGTTLTFSTAPPNGTSVEAIVGASVAAGVPSDASVTSAKLSGALTTPSSLTLGGNLNVSGYDIVTASNGAIDLDPHGSGVVTFKGNATRGAGQFKLNCENNSHGITIKGPPHSAAASYTLTLPNTDGSADQVLKTDGSGNLDWVDSGGGGGVWNVISSQTISSSVSSVTFTGVTGYKVYKLIMTDINHSSSGTADQIQLSSDNGSNFATFNISSIALRYNSGSTSQTFNNDFYQSNKLPLMYSFNEFNNDEKHHVEVTIFGLNDSSFTYTHSRLLSSWGWNANDIGVNETYARTHGSGGLASFNAFKVDAMAGVTYSGGTFTLYGLSNS